jgi:hypothetical protein
MIFEMCHKPWVLLPSIDEEQLGKVREQVLWKEQRAALGEARDMRLPARGRKAGMLPGSGLM